MNTITRQASLEGTGLHTGMTCAISFLPASAGSGIFFVRTDLPSPVKIPALLENVESTVRGTNLSCGGATVNTVEHVLSACAALGIDDIEIRMDGPEPPAMDGSAKSFFEILRRAAITQQGAAPRYLNINKKIEFSEAEVSYSAEPAEKLSFSFLFLHKHPLVSRQEMDFIFSEEGYASEIAPARTFGFEQEIEYLRKMGLAKGGSLDNAVIITADKFLVNGGLRFENEMVRHKILDMTGDFKLLDARLGPMKIKAVCGGHKYNVKFAAMLQAAGFCG